MEEALDQLQLQLIIDLHKGGTRQGPGGEAESKRALALAGLDRSRPLKIADIGCGTGASTLLLARELDADITAVDFLPEFLDVLQIRAESEGVAGRITPLNCSMDALPFAEEALDVIWSEGAIYNIGFEAGVAAWNRYLKPGGKLIVSEITWLQASRPTELHSYWEKAYPEIDLASAKIAILERHGFSPEAHFFLRPHCWLQNYYLPIHNRIDEFLARNSQNPQAKEMVESEKEELALYEKFSDHYSYGFYIARKI